MPYESYRANLPGFATSLELVSDVPDEPSAQTIEAFQETIDIEEPLSFVVATLSLPGGQHPPWDLGWLELTSKYYEGQIDNTPSLYADKQQRLIIINEEIPANSTWKLRVNPGKAPSLPVAANLIAFHSRKKRPPLPSPSPPGPTRKCRGCKITTKALALAIVAAAALPALPAALIASVGAYLGASAIVAGAFISSVLGDTADIVAEKLCKSVGLC